MICVVQRVRSAAVEVEGVTVGEIGVGLLALVAVVEGDDVGDAAHVAERLRHLRIFADEEGRMNLSVEDVAGSVLLVSQFTLAGDVRRGRRPSFSDAADPELARRYLELMANDIESNGVPVRSGEFGAHMAVTLVNDGPVTLIIDSARKRPVGGDAQMSERKP